MKRTYQPKKKKRARTHGFLKKQRNKSPVIGSRRTKQRWYLVPTNTRKKPN